MGYEDPEPLVTRIVNAAYELRNLKNYGHFPTEFQDQFAVALIQQAQLLEALAEQFQSYDHAVRIVRVRNRPPYVPNTDIRLDWYAIAGMPVWKVRRADQLFDTSAFADYTPPPAEAEVVVYLDKYSEHKLEAVQAAALQLGNELGYTDFILTDEQRGSIFRRFRGKLRTGLASNFVQQKMQELDERSSIEVVGRARAETDAIKASSAVKLIASLADIPNAVVRVGGLLIVKQTDAYGVPAVMTRELSTREIRALELNPGIQKDPHGVLQLLAIAVAQLEEDECDVDGGSRYKGA